jgi:hypothetical protein
MGIKLNPNARTKGAESIVKKTASELLWKRADIRAFVLDVTQQEILREFDRSSGIIHVVLASRRIGKSYALVALAIERALSSPNSQIKYITGTNKAARDIVIPLFRAILETCPEDIRPEYRMHESRYKFKNGSEILLHGVDATGGDDLRGQACDLFIVDEAGFIPKLDILIREILMPMIIQRDGRGLLSSTPPKGLDHPFIAYVAKAEKDKSLTKRTIYDCPRFTSKMIKSFEDEAGGRDSEIFRREYKCEIIASSEDSVVPEFTDSKKESLIYSERRTLNYVPDRYVSLDPGFSDHTAILFGYYDFIEACFYIEKEYCAAGNSTSEIASAVKDGEKELWGSLAPTKRVSDVDPRLLKDLRDLHGLKFHPTDKDNKEVQINNLRILIQQGRIRIHESCTGLIQQLKYGRWKTSATGRRDYQRSPELGHLDLVDCLLYLIRNVNTRRNPIPADLIDPMGYWGPSHNREASKSGNARKLSKAFN